MDELLEPNESVPQDPPLDPTMKGGDACEAGTENDREAAAVFEDPAGAADPDPCPPEEAVEADETHALYEEITRLKQEVRERDELIGRFSEEYREFGILYPGVSPDTLPDSVWKDAKRGVPLAAAYALYRHKEALREAAAESANRKNAGRSPGGVEHPGNDYYSPDQVRAMTAEQVKRHYRHILRSMESWK